MYRSNDYNSYGEQQLWIKIDLKEIHFFPKGDIIRKYKCKQIELLLKYTNQNIAMNFIEGQEINEIRIPLDQIIEFRIIQNKYIEIKFLKDFHRTVGYFTITLIVFYF